MNVAPENVRTKLTRRWILTRLGFFVISGCLMAVYTNCAKSSALVPLDSVNLASTPVQKVKVNFCEPPPVNQNLKIKTVIVLDHSGSNAKNYKMKPDGSGEPDISTGNVIIDPMYATDPLGLLRYGSLSSTGSLLNYLANLPANNPANPNRFFALVDFSDNAVSYPAGGTGFTSDIPGFSSYVQTDAGGAAGTPNDQGGTSYLTALNMTYNIINNDLQREKNCELLPTTTAPTATCPTPGVNTASSYVILFMSDGSPIIKLGLAQQGSVIVQQPLTAAQCPYPNQLINGIVCKESTQSILGLVGSIASLASDKQHVAGVNLFSVYYYVPGNVDQNSANLLSQMALAGNGVAYNALSGSSLNYNQFQPPQKQVQYSLADIFVTNASGVWWSDGKFHADTDGDGLPDDVEKAWGSDPLKARTQGNGVSDLVRYRLSSGAACTAALNAQGLCPDPAADYRGAACAGIPTSSDPLQAGAYLYKSSDPSGLNDCEKVLLNDSAGLATPDSNLDSVPDFLEFKNNMPFQAGTSVAVNSPQLDGYTLYNKIKFNLPTQVSITSSPNLLPAVYDLQRTSSVALQNCYRLTVSGLPVVTNNDKIRVDVRFKTNSANVSDQYRLGTKSFSGPNTDLIFNDWTNPSEITAQTWKSWP